MKILEKLKNRNTDIFGCEPVTIAFLGDSVTNGCFELFITPSGAIDTVFERYNAYGARLTRMLSYLFPRAQLNAVNAGISGDSAPSGLRRVERDVLRFQPDLTVVCYGLNDCSQGTGEAEVRRYTDALRGIFEKLQAAGGEVIFMTPNLMCDYASRRITDKQIYESAVSTCKITQSGALDVYLDAARTVAKECGVAVCDCNARWKKLKEAGVDVTSLLANETNHPKREMHDLFAVSLLETIFEV